MEILGNIRLPWHSSRRWMICAMMLFYIDGSTADLQSELQSWMGNSAYVNATPAGVYKSQYGGYWSGGGATLSVQNRQVGKLFSVTPSLYSAGCTGIDSELGGFNFVNKDEIVQQLRAIGQNAKVLAFNLAVKYVSSLLADSMDWVKDKADFLNQLEMDSCTAAQNVLSSGFASVGMPSYVQMNDAEDREICIQRQVMVNGLTRDQAQMTCNQGDQRRQTWSSAGSRFFTGNLAWFVLMRSPVFSADPQLAEWVMNMTGTMIVTNNAAHGSDQSRVSAWIPGMLYTSCAAMNNCLDYFGKAVMDAMIGVPENLNMKVPFYVCSDLHTVATGCAHVRLDAQGVDLTQLNKMNIAGHLVAELSSIMQKLSSPNAQLNSSEKALIEQSALPLYRYTLASQSFFKRTVPDHDVQLYLRMLAQQLVAKNLESLISQVRLVFGSSGTNAASDPKVKMYLDYLGKLAAAINGYESSAVDRMNIELKLLHNAQAYEQALVGSIGHQFLGLINYGWKP